jgi:transcriptional regulator with XRE-family HTH domain
MKGVIQLIFGTKKTIEEKEALRERQKQILLNMIRKYLRAIEQTDSEFAERLGITRAYWTNIKAGRKPLTDEIIKKILKLK